MTATALLETLRARNVQVWEEGGQLRVRAPQGALDDTLKASLAACKQELIALLIARRPVAPIPPRDRSRPTPLSASQRRLFVLEQLEDGGAAAYHIASAFRVDGPLHLEAFRAALDALVARHEVLRTGIAVEDGTPYQQVSATAAAPLEVVDVAGGDDAFVDLARARCETRFDLATPPLLRAVLARLGPERHGLLLLLHHLVADGQSMPILVRELGQLYAAALQGVSAPLPEPRLHYGDFAAWEQARLQGDGLAAHRDHWLKTLRDAPSAIALPRDGRPSPVPAGDAVAGTVADASRVDALARAEGATPFAVVLAGFAAVLARTVGRRDVVIGTPVAGRVHPDLEDQVGCYVNTLALRVDVDERLSFRGLVRQVKQVVADAVAHQEFPFDQLVDDLRLPRELDRPALVDVLMAWNEGGPTTLSLAGLRLEPWDLGRAVTQFELALYVRQTGQALAQYRADLFRRSRIEGLLARMRRLLDVALDGPDRALRTLDVLDAAERERVVKTFNATAADYPRDTTLAAVFEEQARRTPDARAVDAPGDWSYARLDARASALAARLRSAGVGPEDLVGVLAERGPALMVALLGTLKAGAAWVPLSPDDPAARVADMIAEAVPRVVLWDGTRRERFGGQAERWMPIEAASDGARADGLARPGQLAYVLFTSGSTGRPKGVQVTHRSIVNRLWWMQQAYGLTAADVILQKTPDTFDVSVWELFWWSFAGASVRFLPQGDEKDPAAIVAAVEAGRVTTMHFVPSMLRAFLQHVEETGCAARLASLRRVFASGEALPADVVRWFQRLLGGTALHNLYGPTEAAVDVTFYDCARLEPDATVVPIGAPIANTQIHVLDRGLEVVPVGVTGEIFIGGDNLARGYLRRPDLTAERFVPDPFRPGERLYRTGDLGTWRDDGVVVYLGREDGQVKVRGHRIEVGEVEAALRAHPGVRDAAVIARGSGDGTELVAYVVGAAADLRAFLSERLPPSMVPAHVVALDALPLTSSGKLDRKALPAVEERTAQKPFVAPRTPNESALAEAFRDVLGLERVGVDDDFFELGGHSLKAIRVLARVRQQAGLELSLRDLFAAPTVAGLAARARTAAGAGITVAPAAEHDPLSPAQRRLWLLEQQGSADAAYNVAAAFRLTGALDAAALERAWQDVVARHHVLRTRFLSVAGEPRQQVTEATLRVQRADARPGDLDRLARELAEQRFDLAQPPLVRVHLLRFGPDDHGLVVVLHHIVSDGWSVPVLMREIAAAYAARRAGAAPELPPLALQYRDYAVWQDARSGHDDARRFWTELLQPVPPRLPLLPDAPRATGSRDAAQVVLRLAREDQARLDALARANGASLFMTLLAAVQALLARHTGEADVCVGTVTAGRRDAALHGQVGFYVNTLALRTEVRPDEPFEALLRRVRDVATAALDHEDYPFDRLVDDLQVTPEPQRFPLFDVMVVLENNEQAELVLPGVRVTGVPLPPSHAKFDLSFHFTEQADGLQVVLEFRAGIFRRERIEALAADMVEVLRAVGRAPQRPVAELPGAAAETLAVAATFTAEPVEESVAFWRDASGVPTRVVFEPFGQVFQPLLDPASTMSRNRTGANVLLVRVEDWDAVRPAALVPVRDPAEVFAGHATHTLPDGTVVAHLNAYETDDVYKEIFHDRAYLRHGITLPAGATVVDVGANVGLFSLFTHAVCPTARIYAFEPAPPTYEAVSRNLAAYAPGARVFPFGLGETEGELPFTFYPRSSVFSGYHGDVARDADAIRAVVQNAVEREVGTGALSAAASAALMEGRLEARTVIVPVRTVSSIVREHGLAAIDLLKVDAEKSELAVLRGIADEHWPRIRQVVVEVHDEDGIPAAVRDLLVARGFHVTSDEEQRLQGSGLSTVYARRPGLDDGPDLEKTARELADAVGAAALRNLAARHLVVVCPESPSLRLEPARAAFHARVRAGLLERLATRGVPALEIAAGQDDHDPQGDALAHVPYTPVFFDRLGAAIVRRLDALARKPFKVVALDADNTLWRGVCGEDGPANVVVDPPRRELQRRMAQLRREGWLLALCSRNNEDDVRATFAAHPDMPLRPEDFAARRVNWSSKSENLASMAAELGLGLDSFVFLDDSPQEIAEVRARRPEVLALALPADASRIPAFLDAAWAFDRGTSTAEDAARAAFYDDAAQREALRAAVPTLSAFVQSLALEVAIAPMAEADRPRVSQLTLRTNQFNTTTVRRTEAQLAGLDVLVVRVRDRFGDYGLVGVLVVERRGDVVRVPEMMLSCRALGRGVEHRMLAAAATTPAAAGAEWLEIEFAPTDRNRPAREFLGALRPAEVRSEGARTVYRLARAAAEQLTPDEATPSATVEVEGAAPVAASVPAARLRRIGELADPAELERARASFRARRGGPAAVRRRSARPPRTTAERALAALFGDVLGLGDVGADEDFFALGGHSLKAVRLLSRAAQEHGFDLALSDLFAHPTVETLAEVATSRRRVALAPIPATDHRDGAPVSFGQRRLWILEQMGGDGSAAYNLPFAFELRGDVDPAALEAAFRRVLERHEILRTRIVARDGEPWQEVLPHVDFALPVAPGLLRRDEAQERVLELARAPFRLGGAPLLRARLHHLEGGGYLLGVVLHHAVTDGWSMPILVRELAAFHAEARTGAPADVAPLLIQYGDYAAWQRRLTESDEVSRHRAFWRETFAAPPAPLALPTSSPRGPVQTFRGQRTEARLDAAVTEGLQRVAREAGASLFMTVLALLDVLLARWTGQSDVTVGTPVAGRAHPDLEDQIGFFVNTIPLRNEVRAHEPFDALLRRVRERTAAAFDHQVYPFDALVEELRLPRDVSRSPLFDVLVVLENNERPRWEISGVQVQALPLPTEVSRYDLTFHFMEEDGRLGVGLESNADLFSASVARQLVAGVVQLASEVVADPRRAVGALPVLAPADVDGALARSRGAAAATRPETVAHDFAERARRAPGDLAVASGRSRLTYAALEDLAARVAGGLRARGVRPGDVVGVAVPRSEWWIVALLGIQRAGAAYLPLDVALPETRRAELARDAGARLVLTPDDVRALAAGETSMPLEAHAGGLAYVLYTSGSTGRPKGVEVGHAAFASMVARQVESYGLGPGDRVAQFASASFDASLYEVFLALASGAALVIVPDDARRDPAAFRAFLAEQQPTLLVLPPTFLHELGPEPLGSVRLVVTAGEAAIPEDARRLAGAIRYVNAYGPTEFAVCATLHEVAPDEPAPIPIGRPIAGTTAYVLDPAMNLVATGLPGELYLGGAGVGYGYRNFPDGTAARFVPDPFGAPGARLYRTGDKVRWREDGVLEFLGRVDLQVKVRGHRVEPEEIEAQLLEHPAVRESIVMARGEGAARELVAWAGTDAAPDDLRAFLRTRLPEYMVPSRVVAVPALPRNASGKIDRNALPAPMVEEERRELPQGELERVIAEVWCRVLGVPSVGVLDNFFDVGGNSLLLARVLAELRKTLGVELTLVDLFSAPRIRDLAQKLEGAKDAPSTAAEDRAAKQREAQRRRQAGRRP